MNQSKSSNNNFRGKRNRAIIMLVFLFLVLGITVGGTLAYLIAVDGPITNTFTPSKVTTSVEETLEGNIKKNVQIKNTGDTTAYIRAAVVVTWQDSGGNVYGQVPVAGTDYTIVYNIKASGESQAAYQWILAEDGYYYWTSPVKSDDEDANNCMTGILITSCEPSVGKAPEGYSLSVEIIGSGIQSVPISAVTTEWSSGIAGIDENKNLRIKIPVTVTDSTSN